MNSNTKRSIAKALLDIGAVGFAPGAPVTFKSGIVSPVYVDNRTLIYHPDPWRRVVEGFASVIADIELEFDLIAGVAVGGVPHCSALAYVLKKPSVFIRKESKGHGKAQRIEGGAVAGKTVLLVEDLVTTSGSSLSAVAALREARAIVTDMVAIVSYGFAEARRAFKDAQVELHTLTDFDALLEEALQRGIFGKRDEAVLRAWFADPHNWDPASK
ncbi:MAG: orotate phosphoribosyltransferase [Chloroflexi bacterium]|nr:orotate phosphoribosyltransferase [Chloroflexota bacterium]